MASDQVWDSRNHTAQDAIPPFVPIDEVRSRIWRRPFSKAAAILLPVLITYVMSTGLWGNGLNAVTYPDSAGKVTVVRRSGYALLTAKGLYSQTWVAAFGSCVVVLAALLMMSLPFQNRRRVRAAGYAAQVGGLLCTGYFAMAGPSFGDNLQAVLTSLHVPDSVYWNLRNVEWTAQPNPSFLILMEIMFLAYTVCERRTRSVL
jgi:hypothetical protein